MKNFKYFILFIFSLVTANIQGQQITKFTAQPAAFLKEMTDFMENTEEKGKEAKELMNEFEVMWNSSTLTEDQRSMIFTNSNLLLQKRARNFPHFANFLSIIMAFQKNNKSVEDYNNWEKGLVSVIKRDSKNVLKGIEAYLSISANLIINNAIYKSATTEWRSSSRSYKIEIDSTVKIVFDETNLTCRVNNDSIKIFNTKGVFYPLTRIWKGTNGKVNWENAGFSEDKVVANLKKYEIDMTKSNYQADSVIFTNTTFFKEPLLGKLHDKVVKNITKEKASYPKFESYNNRYKIKNLYENVDYDGGFSMHGSKVLGSGTEQEKALLKFYYKDTLKLVTSAKGYTFKKDEITAKNTSIIIYLKEDSIYHPGVLFRFKVDAKTINLIRDGEDYSRTPYFNSYHKLDMDFELLEWKIEDPKMDFKMLKGTTESQAVFESSDYFKEFRYNKLQDMDAENPLVVLKRFSTKIKSDEFTASELAAYMNISVDPVRQMLLKLSFMGLIYFNFDTDKIIIQKRLFNYISARFGKRDYDIIQFNSITPSTVSNASLNLVNCFLKINGVENIQVSDSQNVIIYPTDQTVILKKNRDFEFDGKIVAGLFTFFGSNFSFEYNSFKINLVDVKAFKMQVKTGQLDDYGKPVLAEVQNIIENVKGDLLIDNPFNKSGIKRYPQYPVFNSMKDSYVYYDHKKIHKGVYKRGNFYFQIYPYSIDSLNNLTRNSYKFGGHFTSAGIFPPMDDTLTIQADLSLGFLRKMPSDGLPVYGGKGIAKNNMHLSNKGLRVDGDLEYVASVTSSHEFFFFPDSMNTNAQQFVTNKQNTGVKFPNSKGEEVYEHWMPYEDYMLTNSKKTPFDMFENQATLVGTLKTQETGLTGWGKMELSNAELFSNLFKYNVNTFEADTASFNLKTLEEGEFSFKTHNVNSKIDFTERKGVFKSNGEASFVEFPQIQYVCFIDQFTWYMDKDDIELSSSSKTTNQTTQKENANASPTELSDVQLEGSEFISTHPKQDSLRFKSPAAKYNLKTHVLNASGVKYLRVADGTIYPGDEKVVVEKKAKMQTLSNAKIIANNTSRFHTIYNASVNIYGRKDYNGSGDYDYIDETTKKQTFHFNVVAVDTTTQTYATGKIGIADNFTLSPNFDYTGEVKLFASKELLTFSGGAKPRHECKKVSKNWLKFTAEINPKNILIPISDEPVDINNSKLSAAILLTKDSSHVYTAFASKNDRYSDIPLIKANGFLTYDKSSKKFKISNEEKLIEQNMPGNFLSIHSSFCTVFGEGIVNFGDDFGRLILTSAGSMFQNSDSNEVTMDIVSVVDFFFADNALKLMAEHINKSTELEPVNLSDKIYTKAITEIVGKEKAEALISEYTFKGSFKKYPEELEKGIVFADLKLKWNPKAKSFQSDGKIGIGSILKVQVNKMLKGKVEIQKKRSGDILTIYLEIDDANWYFFTYTRGVMSVISSNPDFNIIIRDLKTDKRKLEAEKGQKPYSFILTLPNKKDKFLKKLTEVEEAEESEGDDNKKKKEDSDTPTD